MQELNNNESYGVFRGKINANFAELNFEKISSLSVLTKTNTLSFIPTGNYHPATKLYVDNKELSIKTTYDPQGKNADAFNRANHTGTQLPSTIVEDSDNRFVSDSQILDWNSKEPAIGVKGTAFNKSFGTIIGTISEGNHLHTKNDIGLSNVDNTSDVNKPISTLQQTALDNKVNKQSAVYVNFIGQNSVPLSSEGTLYYENEHKSLVLLTDIPGVFHNLGQEHFVRVINKTGATIPDFTPVYSNGSDITTGFPTIALARANVFNTSRVIGITTHSISNNSFGFVTRSGVIHGVNTSMFPANTILYLSETIAGNFTDVANEIITILGIVLKSHPTEGSFLVSIQNNVALPMLFGRLKVVSKSFPLTTSYQSVLDYDEYEKVIFDYSTINGFLKPKYSGIYRLNVNLNMTVSTLTTNRTLYGKIYDLTSASDINTFSLNIPKDSTLLFINSSPTIDLIANHEYVVQLSASEAIASTTINSLSYDLQSIKVTE